METVRRNTVRVVEPTDVLWKRVGAYLIDWLILGAVVGAALWILPGVFGSLVAGLLAAVLWIAMFVVMQGATGATPGKYLAGIRVVTEDGEICGAWRAFVRSAFWIVDGFPYVLPLTGYAASFGDKEAQRLGDRAAGTYVVAANFVGQPPFAVAFPQDGREPHRLTTRAAYLPTTEVNPLRARNADAPKGAAISLIDAPPASQAPFRSRLALSAATADPVFDPILGGYKRWDAVHETWVVFDESANQWRATENQLNPSPRR